ncbi:hypothetical protein PGTUg99_002137 [Puccinia graminis f. sp. tritici]|uniref:Uncharacterized protein n=1 Tax=Puccinia graminis f. sp. tritici TaxID=56615 RepID=A0A5B0QKT8_PUCGR|nr:hypothetical protein PGTUg99_028625 [Puccinia graminis f. sp. tritici]KAA1113847.1 hypothetical protein PGTUg99_002137 [Puccinia graminis f. sp. tritici]
MAPNASIASLNQLIQLILDKEKSAAINTSFKKRLNPRSSSLLNQSHPSGKHPKDGTESWSVGGSRTRRSSPRN